MGNFSTTFSSSLGKKLIMSLTGLFICLFLVVHLIGNLQLFKDDSGQAFNSYAYFMTHFTPIKVISYVNYAIILAHAIYALVVTINNRKARPIGYAVYNGSANSPWNSRNMGILGTIILIFLIIHMKDFLWEYHNNTSLPYARYEASLTDPHNVKVTPLAVADKEYSHADYVDAQSQTQVTVAKDLYKLVRDSFKIWWYVALYVISMIAIGFHLVHGFRSAFQTIGWDNKNFVPIIRFLGVWVFGIIIPAAFAAIPLYFFFFT